MLVGARSMQGDPLAAALRQCPFLAKVGAAQGEAFARTLAANPFVTATRGPVLLEDDLSSFAATLSRKLADMFL